MNQIFYADSSVLVKRHAAETGSTWFQNLLLPASNNSIITAKLSIVEVFSAFNRRKREAKISQIDYNDFAKDFSTISNNEYLILELSDLIIVESNRLLETHPLRAGDAIQLATAIYARNMLRNSRLPFPIFLASDNKLLDAAVAEGFTTDNPNLHP
ncbi:MAG: type II toxin-antitoxin system VapC family toxin [Acidobacteria bacterium]|jgi:predicted nucleic acid-binding protein|nr:type II toxin-antitoxin system VapC family toxin [Acidobacteriota bacterium]